MALRVDWKGVNGHALGVLCLSRKSCSEGWESSFGVRVLGFKDWILFCLRFLLLGVGFREIWQHLWGGFLGLNRFSCGHSE